LLRTRRVEVTKCAVVDAGGVDHWDGLLHRRRVSQQDRWPTAAHTEVSQLTSCNYCTQAVQRAQSGTSHHCRGREGRRGTRDAPDWMPQQDETESESITVQQLPKMCDCNTGEVTTLCERQRQLPPAHSPMPDNLTGGDTWPRACTAGRPVRHTVVLTRTHTHTPSQGRSALRPLCPKLRHGHTCQASTRTRSPQDACVVRHGERAARPSTQRADGVQCDVACRAPPPPTPTDTTQPPPSHQGFG
jgi:hypothetical protein